VVDAVTDAVAAADTTVVQLPIVVVELAVDLAGVVPAY
jgi:hypothetical protein